MAIMLEEIKVLIEFVELELPDVFGRLPIDYPSISDPEVGPFCKPNLYEVRCNNIDKLIEFYWDGVLIGTGIFPDWPDKTLPLGIQDNSNYFYYATGKCFYVRCIDDTVAYCYPIQRVELS